MGNTEAQLSRIENLRTETLAALNKYKEINNKSFCIALLGAPHAGKSSFVNSIVRLIKNNPNHWPENIGRKRTGTDLPTTVYFRLVMSDPNEPLQLYDSPGKSQFPQINNIFIAFQNKIDNNTHMNEIDNYIDRIGDGPLPDAYVFVTQIESLYILPDKKKFLKKVTLKLNEEYSNSIQVLYDEIENRTKRSPYIYITRASTTPDLTVEKVAADTGLPRECFMLGDSYTQVDQEQNVHFEIELLRFLFNIVAKDPVNIPIVLNFENDGQIEGEIEIEDDEM